MSESKIRNGIKPPSRKGIKLSEEQKEKLRQANLGKKPSEETLRKLRLRRWSIERKEKAKGKWTGKNNPLWKGGVTKGGKRRDTDELRKWRKAVYERDKYTCQECGAKGVKIQADHIKPFALYPEIRFDINNGRTLCVPCHQKTPTYGGRTKTL